MLYHTYKINFLFALNRLYINLWIVEGHVYEIKQCHFIYNFFKINTVHVNLLIVLNYTLTLAGQTFLNIAS